jgi:hypothetical protein
MKIVEISILVAEIDWRKYQNFAGIGVKSCVKRLQMLPVVPRLVQCPFK